MIEIMDSMFFWFMLNMVNVVAILGIAWYLDEKGKKR